jgi:hypothetical protein
MFRTRWPRICPQARRLKPFDVPSANGSLGAPGHSRRQTNVRLTSILLKNSQIEQLRKSRSRTHNVV